MYPHNKIIKYRVKMNKYIDFHWYIETILFQETKPTRSYKITRYTNWDEINHYGFQTTLKSTIWMCISSSLKYAFGFTIFHMFARYRPRKIT